MKTVYSGVWMAVVAAILGTGQPLQANKTSDRIESSAKKSYVFVTYLKSDDIKILSTDDGVVTLTGTVSEESHRSLAAETVTGLPCVKRVDNNLEVRGGQPAENSDAWIGMKVKTVLMFHKNVSGLKTDVKVQDGVVIVHGEAGSQAQKELTAEYARDVEGVKDVKNEMTVVPPSKTTMVTVNEEIDDASITTQVKMALLFHRSTSAYRINVVTKNGKVTVSGMAKNNAEKDLVGKLVTDIRGVKSVKNKITIG